ncbi:MAG: hypothetical protein ACKOX6_14090 [Bdellovibrio sp.]
MKNTLSLTMIVLFLGCGASAQSNSTVPKWGVEVGSLYFHQDSGGDTTTVLPMINAGLWQSGSWDLNAQIGGTVAKGANNDDTFSIGVLRLNPLYRFADMPFSIEGLLGVQKWEKQDTKVDLGLRGNYLLGHEWVSEIFAAAGSVQLDEVTNYVTVGLKKWF